MHLGDKLKSYKLAKGLDQSEMAVLVGVSLRTYQDIERTGVVKKAKDLDSIKKILADYKQNFAEEPDKDKTIYNLSEAILILADKISLGGGAGASLNDEEERKGNDQADFPFSGNTKRKKKRGGI